MTNENQIDISGGGLHIMGNAVFGDHPTGYQGFFLEESRDPPKPGTWALRLQRVRRFIARPIWWLARRVEGPQWRDPMAIIWKEAK